jgi:phage baseplate assembly protein W
MPISSPVQIFPNDLKPNVGIGIDIPFNKPGVFSSNYQTKDAVKNNLINFFLTNTGERFMNPTFGGGLREFLFEQISNNNISNLKSQIQDQLNVFFSRINLLELDIFTDPDQHTITVFMKYSIKNTGIVDSITIDFNQ